MEEEDTISSIATLHNWEYLSPLPIQSHDDNKNINNNNNSDRTGNSNNNNQKTTTREKEPYPPPLLSVIEMARTLSPLTSTGYVIRDQYFHRIKVKSLRYSLFSQLRDKDVGDLQTTNR